MPWDEANEVSHPDRKSIDHVQPHSKGGRSALSNLQLLCRKCDEHKADSLPEEEGFILCFPLVPPPPDGYEGVIW